MITHDLVQGSQEWDEFRLNHFGASEAAAMLGLSPKVKRSELLHMKWTGNAKEFSKFVQERILDKGHEVEAAARPHVESLLGEDLFPVTCSEGILSASCDGLTMGEDIAFEHKLWNEELGDSVTRGIVPDEYMPQCQQIMMVTGCTKVFFVVSDGTPDKCALTAVEPSPDWFERIRTGWEQFEKDLETYTPPDVKAESVGRTPESLPSLRIEVTGMVTASNLAQFKEHALEVFAGINRDLKTDQDFADAEKTVKWCGDVEDRLKAAKAHALSQTESIDVLFKAIDDITAEARNTRLELDKLVKARKEQVRTDIYNEGVNALRDHIAHLNDRLGKPYMPTVQADFAGAMRGKKTVTSLRDAVSTTLATAKIEANATADKIEINLKALRDQAKDYAFLFSDTAQLVLKAADDCQAVITARISEHKQAEEKRLAAERERIAEEERVKAEAKAAAAQPEPVATPVPVSAAVKSEPVKQPTQATAIATPPTLRLGQICERLGFTVNAEFLAGLGFTATIEKGAKLYHEDDFGSICLAISKHISAVASEFRFEIAA
ncbi:YqaJ viral recombinase family protein [Herminiimonas contaminans]|uniref:YqaJ viral recombinase family protein n=1 Tax=Herminiimonas contaminans TaxID=1111140 RepID=A0ABS0EQT5_9BURK|nr:YqaJ viral recombinase family protein [Herminiimonas contaminans]MBF8177219.1 YqaJ viral recombinase family protein [Herminiimonas contaminans]